MSYKLILGLFLISFIICTSSKPINSTSQAIEFMKKFGYFGKPSETEALLTEEAVIYGLMKVQKFVGLPQTGRLDYETIKLLNTPRCGNPDLQEFPVLKPRRQKRFVLGSNGWEKRKLTYFVANWTPKLKNETFVKSELKRAFQMWADYSGLEFSLSNDYYSSDIIILFGRYSHGDAFPFDGPGLVLAHAYYPYELGTFGGDIHFDEDEDWNQGLDFFTVAVHEIGHALGLAHSSAPDSIMFPYYKGKSEGFALGYDDILAMYQLYISRPFVVEDEESNQTEETSSTSSPTTMKTTSVSSTFSTKTEDTLTEKPTVTSMKPTTIEASTARESTTDSSLLPTVTLTYDGDISDKDSETTTLTYLGDVEEVEDHLKKQEMMHPDVCQGNFDAVTSLRNEVFIFKGLMMWRFNARAQLRPGYPAPFKQMFMGLPEHVRKVDAVYERPGDNHILFFTGRQYWIFDGARFFAPQNISSLGLPSFVDKLDDVFVWGKNGKTYFFYQNLYWRFSPENKSMDPGYPKDIIRNWRGIPRNIDAALTSVFDGRTYFFKGMKFWTFDDYSIQANQARSINGFWTNCNNY